MPKPSTLPVAVTNQPPIGKLESLRRLIGLFRHASTRSGDIAIYKADVLLGQVSPRQRQALASIEPLIPTLDIHALRELPADSFGRAYAEFLDAHGLHPFTISEEVPSAVVDRNAHWARYALLHDMFHVLLGYGPDLAGEMGVYAFSLAQRTSTLFWIYLPLAWLVMPLLAPHRVPQMIRNFRRGFRLGRALDNMLARRLEGRFTVPLEQLRDELGFV